MEKKANIIFLNSFKLLYTNRIGEIIQYQG